MKGRKCVLSLMSKKEQEMKGETERERKKERERMQLMKLMVQNEMVPVSVPTDALSFLLSSFIVISLLSLSLSLSLVFRPRRQ